jgi:hypothetical protein
MGLRDPALDIALHAPEAEKVNNDPPSRLRCLLLEVAFAECVGGRRMHVNPLWMALALVRANTVHPLMLMDFCELSCDLLRC